MSDELRVGSTVWVFDRNYRVYRDGRPVYREYWRPTEITGENRVNWITWYGKFPKKSDVKYPLIPQGGYAPLQVAIRQDDVEEDIWLNCHALRISELVRESDSATLRKVAELIGYKEEAAGESK